MGLRLVTPPAVEPVTLAEAKAHLRLESNADDAYVSALIAAARERVEHFLRRGVIDLPRPPLQSVESIRFVDTAGDLQALAPEDYLVDDSSREIGRVAVAWNRFWPFTRPSINGVVIRFTAGFGDSGEDVPQAIRQGILIEISNLYENREDIVVGQSISMLPLSERLLWPYRALSVE